MRGTEVRVIRIGLERIRVKFDPHMDLLNFKCCLNSVPIVDSENIELMLVLFYCHYLSATRRDAGPLSSIVLLLLNRG